MAKAMFSFGFGLLVVVIFEYIFGIRGELLYIQLGISGALFLGSIAAKYLNITK